MKYPYAATSIKLYEKNDEQLREIAHQAAKAAEPKKTRIAFKIGITVSAISIVGLPLVHVLKTAREEKRADNEESMFNKLVRIRQMQVTHSIKEDIRIFWMGNALPDIGFGGDTSLVWNALEAHPNCPRFDIEDLRRGGSGVPVVPVSTESPVMKYQLLV